MLLFPLSPGLSGLCEPIGPLMRCFIQARQGSSATVADLPAATQNLSGNGKAQAFTNIRRWGSASLGGGCRPLAIFSILCVNSADGSTISKSRASLNRRENLLGTSFIARCAQCDYEAHGSIGGGMHNHRTFSSWPCLCNSCDAITTVNTLAQTQVCLQCSAADPLPYDDAALSEEPTGSLAMSARDVGWGDRVLSAKRRYYCPNCRTNSILFRQGNINWD